MALPAPRTLPGTPQVPQDQDPGKGGRVAVDEALATVVRSGAGLVLDKSAISTHSLIIVMFFRRAPLS